MHTTFKLLCFSIFLSTIKSEDTVPSPFLHNPKIPPSVYHGDNQKFLRLPGGPETLPNPPPPPPGFSSYGTHTYKDKSGMKRNNVKAGIGLWELMKNSHHHHHYGIKGLQNGSVTFDDVIRERYTTKIIPTTIGAYNILEMTNYVNIEEKGVIYSYDGNTTCISIYNSKSMKEWHDKQLQDFHKLYPESVFPLYRMENYTKQENFTVKSGRIIHREPISITCCGTGEKKLNLNYLTNGRHSKVNCVHYMGVIPIKKLIYIKNEEKPLVSTTGWKEIELREPNSTLLSNVV